MSKTLKQALAVNYARDIECPTKAKQILRSANTVSIGRETDYLATLWFWRAFCFFASVNIGTLLFLLLHFLLLLLLLLRCSYPARP